MYKLIQDNQHQLEQLCRRFHAQRLEVFGSATRDDFDPAISDIDFLVEFDESGLKNYADNFFGLQESLQALFNRSIELVVISSVNNPYFLQSIEKNRTVLYAA